MSELLSIVLFVAAIAVYAVKAGRNIWWFGSILLILTLYIILNVTLVASNYFTGDGINDAVLYTLTSSLTGAGIGKYILPGLGVLAGLVVIFGLLTWILRRRKNHPHHFGYSLLAVVLALACVDASSAFRQVVDLVKTQTRNGESDFDAYYKVPHGVINNPKLNLVYIYGESLERTYFQPELFPDLAPELTGLKDSGLDFSHTGQLPGTGYTIAGMVSSQCGIPLFAPFEGNSSASVSSIFPKNVCLGDILKASGYENYFMQGADLRFGGKDVFLQSHGFDHMYGAQELKTMVADPSYKNNWGYYDDTVLDEVYEKFIELSKANKRFSLFTLTVDTHHPDGFISKTCNRRSYTFDGKVNQSFSAVACSQEHVAALIEKIKASPYFKNTVIVVSSDHLAMNNTAYTYLNKQERDNLFFIIRGDKPEAKLIPVKRSTMDNGATVLDILGGDNYIGLGRSSISGESLSSVFLNIKDKILEWKPDVIDLWNFPKTITEYTIEREKNTFSFSGAHFKMPLLLRISEDKIEPLPESEYSAPLRYQLAGFSVKDKFIWVDRCFKMARLWEPKLALSTGLCVSQGQLGGKPSVHLVEAQIDKQKVKFADELLDKDRFNHNVATLRIDENAIRYQADSFIFSVPGAPLNVKQFTGISRPEDWGRWSNANLAPEVKIEYAEPLPEKFDLVITAKAFGPNAGKPVPVKVGNQQQTLTLGAELSTTTLHFDNPERSNTLEIIPPEPQLSNEGNILGHEPRKLGIGMENIKVVPAA
ncbi:phosphatidylglycerol--membrane-oligosaccharide glycerophosphotransferase [Enterobacteriaceae bacterium H20N1]|uniref:Phosphatidylglycerol--membrane-oligosaccharide glycerophosphotransferase n=1 Tax=Dryocola boscaweniae TaxID=2925397 RepID=A0A9X2W5Y4_9ENTR|nr:phosphatidylglycerol--membrane-oligosaccharide glycerophosphotransferase [Dryocola boscaweniae]MCT4701648.1 phosphatidylglycerol--membrane-oligosaccharide glycerophosphotransferase [Dryocola boscaweniae]MCT4718817.1 phosphatidylglycerol--membrane-oligosaccharide glycerophosphotransferase [Dryocola boscaweniae]